MSEEIGECEPGGSSAKIWDREAARYDVSRKGDAIYQACIYQTIVAIPRHTHSCLDAGCGTGISTAALARRCDSIIAVDYSAASLSVLKNKEIGNVIPVQSDITSLPFEDSTFDAAVCANTLQHLCPGKPQQQAICEIRRVTKHDGIIAVSVHHHSKNKIHAGWVKEGKPGQPGIDYIFRFSRKELAALMPCASIRGVGLYGLLKVPFLGSCLQDFAARMFGSYVGIFGYGHMLVAVERNAK